MGGDWQSVDNIGIRISSALVSPRDAKELAIELSKENPFRAWLPRFEEFEDEDEHSRSRRKRPQTMDRLAIHTNET